MSVKEKISDLIFNYENEWFKERISNLILNYEKEWVLKKEFQIWFSIMKRNKF